MQMLLILATVLQAVTLGSPADSLDALRRLARQKEYRYERLLRTLAPQTFSGGWRDDCDEIVGRFCLWYSDAEEESSPWREAKEAVGIVEARREAIDVFRRVFAFVPGDFEAAGPLVRYLVEDGRGGEAVAAARAFAWASADSVWGPLLEGFALHATGADGEAESRFRGALAAMAPEDRRDMETLDPLLVPRERRRLEDLDAGAQARYRHRFWVLADPLYLTPGNETWNEHMARHVWTRLLSRAPRVVGAVSWGDDLEELTLRFGVPTSRERVLGTNPLQDDNFVEHYDPASLAFTRPDLLQEGVPEAPEPGGTPYLEESSARSIYAATTVARFHELPHQVTRFPARDDVVVRIDAQIPLDSLGSSVRDVETGVFLLDSTLHVVGERRNGARRRGGALRLTEEFVVPPGQYVYSVEARDSVTRNAARARYAVEVEGSASGVLALSDIVLTRPFRDRPLPRSRDELRQAPLVGATVEAGGTVGLYAEAHWLAAGPDGRSHYDVTVALEREDRPVAAVRLLRWIGRALGIRGSEGAPRIRWTDDAPAGAPAILAVDLGMDGAEPGLYRVVLSVRDAVLGTERTSSRLLLVGTPGS